MWRQRYLRRSWPSQMWVAMSRTFGGLRSLTGWVRIASSLSLNPPVKRMLRKSMLPVSVLTVVELNLRLVTGVTAKDFSMLWVAVLVRVLCCAIPAIAAHVLLPDGGPSDAVSDFQVRPAPWLLLSWCSRCSLSDRPQCIMSNFAG